MRWTPLTAGMRGLSREEGAFDGVPCHEANFTSTAVRLMSVQRSIVEGGRYLTSAVIYEWYLREPIAALSAIRIVDLVTPKHPRTTT